MAWATLFLLAGLCSVGAYLCYRPDWMGRWWYTPAFGVLSLLVGLLFGWAVQRVGDQKQVYAFNLAWDAVVVVAYVLLPLAAFGVRLTIAGWVGLALIVAGTILVKVSH